MTTTKRLSASVDADLVESGRRIVAAGRAPSLSAWVNAALRAEVERDRRLQALGNFVATFEPEHGEITEAELSAGRVPVTHGGVVAQVWRAGSARQAVLSRFLHAVAVEPLDEALGRQAGSLLAGGATSDVIGAALAMLAETAT